MNKRNWPYGTDMSEPNWTGRTARQMRDYKRPDDRIPTSAWIFGLLALALVFGFFPLLSLVML
jgi:hypothetical protein